MVPRELSKDHVLFERLVAEHRAEVLRVGCSVLRDPHLAADAEQETFLRLWQWLRKSGSPDRPGAWLRRTAIGASIDLLRRRRTRGDADLVPVESEPATAQDDAPLEGASLGELRRRLDAAVATLPAGQREVFLLRHEGGLTLAEVAATLEVAVPTVKTQFARACLKLQASLTAYAPRNEEAKK